MTRILLLALVLGACSTEDPEIYLNVDMRPGTIEEPRGDWANGYAFIDANNHAKPPGVFTVRVRAIDPNRIRGAVPEMRVASLCSVKTQGQCADGACLFELVQSELGLCKLDFLADTNQGVTDTCWFMGTFDQYAPTPRKPTADEAAELELHDCGGTATW